MLDFNFRYHPSIDKPKTAGEWDKQHDYFAKLEVTIRHRLQAAKPLSREFERLVDMGQAVAVEQLALVRCS